MSNRIFRNVYQTGFFVLILLLLISCGPGSKSTNDTAITIMAYNIRNGVEMDGMTDYTRIAGVINHVLPDVVALQELDSATTRSGGVVVLDELAKLTKLYPVYGPAIFYQGGKYGIGLLCREKPEWTQLHALPGREEQRAILVAGFENYIVCSTHFSLTREDRRESVSQIKQITAGYDKPVFLAGDINDTPGSEVLNSLLLDWQVISDTTVYTSRSDNPVKCIDYIFALKSDKVKFETEEFKVVSGALGSDHLPLWARVRIME